MVLVPNPVLLNPLVHIRLLFIDPHIIYSYLVSVSFAMYHIRNELIHSRSQDVKQSDADDAQALPLSYHVVIVGQMEYGCRRYYFRYLEVDGTGREGGRRRLNLTPLNHSLSIHPSTRSFCMSTHREEQLMIPLGEVLVVEVIQVSPPRIVV